MAIQTNTDTKDRSGPRTVWAMLAVSISTSDFSFFFFKCMEAREDIQSNSDESSLGGNPRKS